MTIKKSKLYYQRFPTLPGEMVILHFSTVGHWWPTDIGFAVNVSFYVLFKLVFFSFVIHIKVHVPLKKISAAEDSL